MDFYSYLNENYKKYRWFFTSSGKLVVGGKSAEQNDSLLKSLISSGRDLFILHTEKPGSPFSVILSEPNSLSQKDFQECAIFTACFSRAWKESLSKSQVHIFKLNQISKDSSMKEGSWAVKGKINSLEVSLSLGLTIQKSKLRAVPEKYLDKKDILLRIAPGKTQKVKFVELVKKALNGKFKKEEILSAVPSGGSKII